MDIELNYKLIGMRLRAERLKKKYTQEYLAELAGISPQHCSGIECGSAKLSLPCLVSMCNALKITPNDILMDSVDNSIPLLLNQVATVFADCSNDEIFLMLSQADNLKKSLRLKNLRLTNE
jgi:transcriptional regulator with XRE-family HTH domain